MVDDNVAVLLIDMQPRFMKLLSATKADSLLRSQRNVLDYCVRRDVPLVILEYKYPGETHDGLKDAVSLVPRKTRIIKSDDDGFKETDLETRLDELDPEYLVLMGINASACVFHTAVGAADRGFQLATARELIGDGHARWGSHFVRRWYRENGNYFGTAHELVEWMDSIIGKDNVVKEKVY